MIYTFLKLQKIRYTSDKVSITINDVDRSSKIESLFRYKRELELSLNKAAILWNDSNLDKCGEKIFYLVYQIQKITNKYFYKFRDRNWEFSGEDIESNLDFQLIFFFDSKTENKTTDELNNYYQTKLREAKCSIMDCVAKYLP